MHTILFYVSWFSIDCCFLVVLRLFILVPMFILIICSRATNHLALSSGGFLQLLRIQNLVQ